MEKDLNKSLTLKMLSKGNVWNMQENDILRMMEQAQKDIDLRENFRHYLDIIKTAFEAEEIKIDKPEVIKKYQDRGFKVKAIKSEGEEKIKWAVKKRPINRVTDLTYENIHHISAETLLKVIERNFGGGWESLSQSIRDVIEKGFSISTITLPHDRLHKKGGMYEKKINDGFEVLEVAKGTWVEAIFAKAKPEAEKPRMKMSSLRDLDSDSEEDDDADVEIEDTYNKPDEDDMELEEPNDEDITEDNYSTMMDLGSGDPDEEAENISDYGDE